MIMLIVRFYSEKRKRIDTQYRKVGDKTINLNTSRLPTSLYYFAYLFYKDNLKVALTLSTLYFLLLSLKWQDLRLFSLQLKKPTR